MFDKFGEFNSYEELNRAAEGFKKEGDKESLLALAEENGIEKEDAMDYLNGGGMEFAMPVSAAYGRLDVLHMEEIENNGDESEAVMLEYIFQTAEALCISEKFAISVMKKGKRLKKILKLIEKEAVKHKTGNKAGINISPRQLAKITEAYFQESEKKCETAVKEAYEETKNEIQRRKERRKAGR